VLEGISVQRLREEILSLLPRAFPTSGDLPLSASAKKALTYGDEEADRLGDRQIRNQHLLLGIMRIEDCSAARLLTQKGLRPETLRVRIAELSPEEETRWAAGPTPEQFRKSPGIPAGYAWPRLLYNPASEVLIVELRAAGQQFMPTRLFMRHKDSDRYEQIAFSNTFCPHEEGSPETQTEEAACHHQRTTSKTASPAIARPRSA
jgi:ATP-dependent Clp protease ATP-binding subunit ClpA